MATVVLVHPILPGVVTVAACSATQVATHAG